MLLEVRRVVTFVGVGTGRGVRVAFRGTGYVLVKRACSVCENITKLYTHDLHTFPREC